MIRLQLDLAEDRRSITLGLSEKLTLTAADFEKLLQDLARFRASMKPAVQDGPLKMDTPWSVIPCTSWTVRTDHETPTRTRLFMRHPGFGWVTMPLDERSTKRLATGLEEALKARPKLS